jgi:hypothetical protein
MQTSDSVVAGVHARVRSDNSVWLVAGIALLLTLPSLRIGLQTDDHVANAAVAARLNQNPFTAFGMEPHPGFDRSSGYLAWWSSPQLRIQFMRPLAALSHIDMFLGPRAAWLMHGINALLYVAIGLIAYQLYRQLLPSLPRVAALASLLFAIDDGHASAVGWISARNSLLYTLFALAALLLQHRSRATPGLRPASAALTALALLSGEGGSAIVAYLIAYEVAFERGTLRERISRLWLHGCVVSVWLVAYIAGGYGVRGASFYRELSEPIRTLGAGLAELPYWLFGLLGPSAIGAASLLPRGIPNLVAALLCLLLLAAVSRAPRTPENRFFALGALLCLPPLFTTVPQDRVLMLASFGAAGLIASFISSAADATSRYVRSVRWVLIAIHGVLAPLAFVLQLDQFAPIEAGANAVVAAIPERAPAQVILVNTPVELLTIYAHAILREQPARTPPEVLQQLYAGGSPLTATRIDEHTLELRAERGWGANIFERIFGRVEYMPRPGDRLQLDRLEVAVQESNAAGYPVRVQFRFASPLESPERLFLAWQGSSPKPWQPPAVGQQALLPTLNFPGSLPR